MTLLGFFILYVVLMTRVRLGRGTLLSLIRITGTGITGTEKKG
jgi:hypothetical protein